MIRWRLNMNRKSPLLWLIPLILLLLLVPFIVPSALTYAGAEALDLPVFSPVELANPHPEPLLPLPSAKDPDPTPYAPHPEGFINLPAKDDSSVTFPVEYRDSTIYVKVEKRVIHNTNVFFTWIQIADPSQLRTYITRETNPVKLASQLDAVVAINGDWYSERYEGTIYRNTELVRPARSTRERYDVLIVDDEGNFHILHRPKDDAIAPYEGNILHSFLFGPGLVIDGKLMTDDENTFVRNQYGSGAGMGLGVKAQRQAICQMGKLSYLILTTEGPHSKQDKDHGFTAAELAQVAYDVGAVNAYNMDGGNSTCLALGGVKLNRFGKGGIRETTDMVYFITAEPSAASAVSGSEGEGSAQQ